MNVEGNNVKKANNYKWELIFAPPNLSLNKSFSRPATKEQHLSATRTQ